MEEATACAKRLSHPFSLAFAHYFSAWFHTLCREDQLALEAADAAVAICDEFGFPFWGLSSRVLRGSTLVAQGAVDEGITLMRDSLASFEATGALLYRSALYGLLASALGVAGQPDEGLQVLDEAIAGLGGREERWWEPELHRLRGELLLTAGGDRIDEAQASFEQALEVARNRRARWWELRAATGLARLWREQGRSDRAARLLADVASAFTDEQEGADLRQARSLLAELETPVA
jgi:predicted ATPase